MRERIDALDRRNAGQAKTTATIARNAAAKRAAKREKVYVPKNFAQKKEREEAFNALDDSKQLQLVELAKRRKKGLTIGDAKKQRPVKETEKIEGDDVYAAFLREIERQEG